MKRPTAGRNGPSLPRSAPNKADVWPDDEKAVAERVDAEAALRGWTIERYEQTRATRICQGLPDRRYVHRPSGWRVWVELKRPDGKLTEAQHAWLLAEVTAGGLAIPVDDPAVLVALHGRWKRLYGQADALNYCREVIALTAARGYRAA